MWLILKIDDYAHVLKMMGDRDDPERSTIFWIAVVFAGVLLLLVIANLVRTRIRRKLHQDRSLDQLEHLAASHDLNYVEQTTLERMASVAKLPNPSRLATSVEAFDQAAAAWMEQAVRKPWLEMEAQVSRLSDIRDKLEFRYLPPDRRPANTRHLVLGQRLYVLAAGQKHVRLLRTSVIDMDDLAIRTDPFSEKAPVRLPGGQDFLVFFWSEDGSEYGFKTRVLKSFERPMPFLYLKHADALTADEGRKTISCDVDIELSADWLSAAGYGNAAPSANLFTRLEDKIQSLPMHIREISGSGFTFASREMVEVNDLLRIQGGKGILKDLDGSPARVVREGSGQNFARFIKLSPEDREALLEYIVPKISTDAFKKRAGERAAAKE